jgi:hypothetical protein
MRSCRLQAFLAVAVLGSVAIATTVTAHTDTVSKAEHAPLSVEAARDLLHTLTVAQRHAGGYRRARFGDGWTVDPATGCTTRQLVLAAEAVDGHPNPDHPCRTIGSWADWYATGEPTIGKPKQIEIDHLVPLANAWHSGAWAWTDSQREAFANDRQHPYTLTAVSVAQNQAKGASGPERWQPPNKTVHCTYATDWIAIKHDWTLTVTVDEEQALDRMLNECLVTPLVSTTQPTSPASTAVTPASPSTTTTVPGHQADTPTKTVLPASSTTVARPTVPPTSNLSPPAPAGGRPLLIEHGWDVATAASTRSNAARIDALPFDGISVAAASDPCSTRPATLAAARADLGVMPKLAHVTHNFVMCRFFDNATRGSTVGPYEMSNDQTWATIANNLAAYAQAAREVGGFDGIMIDTEYYGTGPNPWDYDTIPIAWTYGASRPWTLPAPAKALAQARGKQITDAIKRVWPTAVLFHFRGAELSDPASFTEDRMMGNQVAWANELAGPFFLGAVESAAGSSLTLVDAGESYRQRTPQQFANAYRWLKTGLADSNGPIVPSGPVTAAMYKATVTVASHLFDRDMNHSYANFTATDVADLLSMAMNPTVTDEYCWIYTEQHDWRGSGWPQNAVPAPFTTAIVSARTARSAG